ncbi:hypothetical protein ACIQVL_48890 [Streptomyces sp. NPDC090499]|uniref:hypothetical protein n=1 Tax=Streptomyces sp. NPDC090499 TaxID=3365965 RepID=UPI0037FE2011
MSGPFPSTEGNAVPSVDGTDLGDTLTDLDGIHPGIDLIRDGVRLLAHDRLDVNTTQVLIAALAGSADGTDVLAAIGQLVARLTNADTNPALRHLPLDVQKDAAHQGFLTSFHLGDSELRNSAATANAALDH